jgi:uncharacterized protein (TIGR02118 family)
MHGTELKMIKLVYCISKKTGLTDQAFFDHWERIHAPIGARIPGLRRFVQSRRLIIPGDKHKPDYDGMVELWFDDVDALLAARQSPEWDASSKDEENFIDHTRIAYFVSEERVVIDSARH